MNIKDNIGDTVLHMAIYYLDLRMIKLIIDKGRDLFVLNKKEEMGFDLSVKEKQIEVAKLIMNRIENYIIDLILKNLI